MNIKLSINDFEGPLDLLLHLVKEAKVNIYELNTTEIINQYLDYIHNMEEANIDVASEYLVMAAELVHLKSRLLVNDQSAIEEDSEFSINTEEDLKSKLLEYEKYKVISNKFKDLEEKRSEVYTKLPEFLNEYKEEGIFINHNLTIDDLLNALLNFQQRHKFDKPLHTKITKREESIEERKTVIRDVLKNKGKINFVELFTEYTKKYIILTLLSVLDMVKDDEIVLTQKRSFSPIYVESK